MESQAISSKFTPKTSSFSITSILADKSSKDATVGVSSQKRQTNEYKNTVFGRQGLAVLLQPDSIYGPISVTLENKGLWDIFHEAGTEMVITKSGRRMFPALKVTVAGLNPSLKYIVELDVVPSDNYRYKYHESEWLVTGKAYPDVPRAKRRHTHPESPGNGAKWMAAVISFHKIKITNNSSGNKAGHIVLNSLHKYQPRIRIVQANSLDDVTDDDIMTFVFPETSFMAVTAYQSEQITQLKIDNNPFAKGFRDPSPGDLERARLMNVANFGVIGNEMAGILNRVPDLYIPTGICTRSPYVLPAMHNKWSLKSKSLQMMHAAPMVQSALNSDVIPPKRLRLQVDHNCTAFCQCKRKITNAVPKGCNFNQYKTYDSHCTMDYQHCVPFPGLNSTRQPVAGYVDCYVKKEPVDVCRSQRISSPGFVHTDKTICSCCWPTEHKQINWNTVFS